MGRVVQLEGGCSTSGRWFLAWVGWFYVCKSSVRGAVFNVLRGVRLFKEISTLCKLDQSQLSCPTMVKWGCSLLEYR